MVGQSVNQGETATMESMVGLMLHFEEKRCRLE
jgi:hypothetical protein